MIQRKKATFKIEITKPSLKKLTIKISHYSTATSDMSNEERVKHFNSECFQCPNEPIFINNLKENILAFILSEFEKKGVEEIKKEKIAFIYE